MSRSVKFQQSTAALRAFSDCRWWKPSADRTAPVRTGPPARQWGEQILRHAEELDPEIPDHREQGTEMHRHVEGEPLVPVTEDRRRQDQVGGARNRQELGETLSPSIFARSARPLTVVAAASPHFSGRGRRLPITAGKTAKPHGSSASTEKIGCDAPPACRAPGEKCGSSEHAVGGPPPEVGPAWRGAPGGHASALVARLAGRGAQ